MYIYIFQLLTPCSIIWNY